MDFFIPKKEYRYSTYYVKAYFYNDDFDLLKDNNKICGYLGGYVSGSAVDERPDYYNTLAKHAYYRDMASIDTLMQRI